MKPSARTNKHQKHKASATDRGWVVYCRVSTEEQATGHSLDNQKRLCVEWLKEHNFHVRQVITDAGESGSRLRRPGISSLQDLLDQGVVAGVVVTKLDRLSRSLRDVLTLTDRFKRENADFQCISQTIDSRTATGKMHLHFLAVFAEFERDQISERQIASHAYRKKMGLFAGGSVPAGFCIDGSPGDRRLIIDPTWGPIVANLWSLVEQGKSLRDCANFLQGKGVPSRNSGRWSANSVSGILRRPWSRGTLVTAEKYDRIRSVLSARKSPHQARSGGRPPAARPTPSGNTSRVWILQGLGRCAHCGSALTGTHGNGRRGTKHFYLKCCSRSSHASGVGSCTAPQLPAPAWEGAVVNSLGYLMSQSTLILESLARETLQWAEKMEPLLARRESLTFARDGAVVAIRRLIKLATISDTVDRSISEGLAEWQQNRETAELALIEVESELQQGRLSLSDSEGIVALLRDGFAELECASPETKKIILNGLLAWVRLGTSQKGCATIVLGIKVPASGVEIHKVDEMPNPVSRIEGAAPAELPQRLPPKGAPMILAPAQTSEPAKNCRTPDRDQGFDCTYTMADQHGLRANRRVHVASPCRANR